MGMVIDDDEAATVGRQAVDRPLGLSAVDSRRTMPCPDRALDLGTVQESPLPSPLGMECPDEVFDWHRRPKLCVTWDGIRRRWVGGRALVLGSAEGTAQDSPQIRAFFAIKKNLVRGVDFCWRSGIGLFMCWHPPRGAERK
jgi:hypothetical protein